MKIISSKVFGVLFYYQSNGIKQYRLIEANSIDEALEVANLHIAGRDMKVLEVKETDTPLLKKSTKTITVDV